MFSVEKRETWWPPRRRLRLAVFLAQTVLAGSSAALQLANGRRLGILALVVAVFGAFLALEATRSRVETDAAGLRVVGMVTATWIPWPEIAEVRPDARPPWGDRLVVVKRDGDIVKLPLPPMDEVVERWKRATPAGTG